MSGCLSLMGSVGGHIVRNSSFGAMNGNCFRFLCLPVVLVCAAVESIVCSLFRIVVG